MLKACPRALFSLLLAALTLTVSACQNPRTRGRWGDGPPLEGRQARLHVFDHGGQARDYWLYLPEQAESRKAMPLVLALHGGGGTGYDQQRLSGGIFNRLAEREGFIVCYPSGLERHWNDGRTEVRYRSHVEKIDDVGFLKALVKDLQKRHAIDERRIFATGMSNGSMMSHRLALEASELFAAVAPVGGGLPAALASSPLPARPVSVLEIRGTADPLVPFAGGQIGLPRRKNLGRVLAAEDTAAWWVKANACPGPPVLSALPDPEDDGCHCSTKTWKGGREGREVQLVTIHGGGHTWPGGSQYFGKWIIGTTCRDFSACEFIWAFFARNGRLAIEEAGRND